MTQHTKFESPDEYFDRLSAAFSTLSALSRPTRVESATPLPETPGVSLMAEAFSALLALEEGTPGAKPVRLVSRGGDLVSDAFVEDLTRRVAQRMAPDAVRAVVTDVVSQVAERLVKEEIARIRKGGNG
jgi:hypothetical protein